MQCNRFQNGTLYLRRYIQFDFYVYIVWAVCNGISLLEETDVAQAPKPLMVTAYCMLLIAQLIRIYLTHYQGFTHDFPKLVGFTLVTILIQLPLVSSFLVVSCLSATPTEVLLNITLLIFTCFESAWSIRAVRDGCQNFKSSLTYDNRFKHPTPIPNQSALPMRSRYNVHTAGALPRTLSISESVA